MLNKQVKIYSVDTKAFYTQEENEINEQLREVKTNLKIVQEYLKYIYLCKLDNIKVEIDAEEHLIKAKRLKYLKYMIGALSLEQIDELKQLEEYFRAVRKVIAKDTPRANRNKEKDEQEGKVYYRLKNSEFSASSNKNQLYKELSSKKNVLKKQLEELIYKNKESNTIRELNESALIEHNIISIFESALTRTLGIETGSLSMDMLVVRIYYYDIMNSLICNGFTYNGDKYIFFTASAGQIRQKKLLLMKQCIYEKFEKTFLCGLTREDINRMGGINTNKFLSYLALNSSGTDEIITSIENIFEDEIEVSEEEQVKSTQEIKGFNIDRCIVIPDFKTEVSGVVDYISKKEVNKNFKIEERNSEGKLQKKTETRKILELQDNIVRQKMDIEIEHSDGCGWVLNTVSKVNHMIRLPWIKGLMASNNYLAWCKEFNEGNYKIKDVDGKEWDLKADNIEYVFTESQWKLNKFYQNEYKEDGTIKVYGWDKYKKAFKENNCKANICNIEPLMKKDYRKAKFSYQIWQSLVDITDEEIKKFTEPAKEYLELIYTDKDTMLKELKADESNKNKSYFQKVLSIYPELLKDPHCKTELSSKISSKKKQYKSGKFEMNAYNTFVIPDLFAWMQYVFYDKEKFNKMLENNEIGLLKDGEVSCKLFKEQTGELILERFPHLYQEHGIRTNIINELTGKWFKTNAVYTSCYDLISKLLQFDCDGDHLLIINEPERLLPIVKRNMGYGLSYKDYKNNWNMKKIVPLYYEMGKAEGQPLNSENFYNSLLNAFKSSNIGKYSNQLAKLWAKTNKDDDLTVHKVICALNNFSIDSAKTLQPAFPTENTDKLIKQLEKDKLPYFFMFAKKKNEHQVNEIGNGTVDRIAKEIETLNKQEFDYSKVGRFSYKTLMNNSKIAINNNIIEAYKELNDEKDTWFMKTDMDKQEVSSAIYDTIKYEFALACEENDVEYKDAVDMVIKYIYTDKKLKTQKKSILFTVFGEEIINNLNKNINKPLGDGYIKCQMCGKRIKKKGNRQTMCEKCSKEKRKQDKLKRQKQTREKLKN